MQFKTAFAILISLSVGLNSCLAAVVTTKLDEEQVRIRNDIQKLISNYSDAKTQRASREGEYDVLPSIERLLALINLDAAIELIGYESSCGAETWEYLRGPEFELVMDDFWSEPGILGIFEFIATNGFEYIYDFVGLIHLVFGLKLPDLPYTDGRLLAAQAPVSKGAVAVRAEDECTPEDQEAIAEIASRIVPIWKMVDVILELLAVDESFVAIILRVREPDVIESYLSFIKKDSAIALGERMEAIGIPPRIITGIWNLFFGLNEQP